MFSCLIGEVVNKDKEIKRCLIDAYRKTDEEFLQEATKQYVITNQIGMRMAVKLFAIDLLGDFGFMGHRYIIFSPII